MQAVIIQAEDHCFGIPAALIIILSTIYTGGLASQTLIYNIELFGTVAEVLGHISVPYIKIWRAYMVQYDAVLQPYTAIRVIRFRANTTDWYRSELEGSAPAETVPDQSWEGQDGHAEASAWSELVAVAGTLSHRMGSFGRVPQAVYSRMKAVYSFNH
ncbi:hypothetical protein DFH07DRAFT_773254 [Mycena maculata]|uniref:Uncharacterized protein n=1 Tax=Mycena maculata TaxID=230809 RepID=A0AAD7J3D7_9AGAR|nr:hypothetical protein DFH07DRAFT_773254 [Mycena maculata]